MNGLQHYKIMDLSKGGNNILGQPRDYSGRSERKKHAKPGQHIMNKNESKLLRKLMHDTEMTEKELREHKKYRKMLSDAQKVPVAKMTDGERMKKNIMKDITKEFKLAKEHPIVVEEFKNRWNEYISGKSHWFRIRLGI